MRVSEAVLGSSRIPWSSGNIHNSNKLKSLTFGLTVILSRPIFYYWSPCYAFSNELLLICLSILIYYRSRHVTRIRSHSSIFNSTLFLLHIHFFTTRQLFLLFFFQDLLFFFQDLLFFVNSSSSSLKTLVTVSRRIFNSSLDCSVRP